MGLELGLPFLGTLIVIWLLRRLDKSNINLKKFKGVLEQSEKHLTDIVLEKTEELKDATTEFEILQINIKKQLISFQNKVDEAETVVTDIEAKKSNLSKIGDDLSTLEETTRSVQGQLAYVGETLDKIDLQSKKLKKIENRLDTADSEGSKIVTLFQESIDKKSKEQLDIIETRVQDILNKADYYEKEIKEEIKNRQNKLSEEIKQEYTLIEDSLRKSGQELSENIKNKFNNHLLLCDGLKDKISDIENQVTESIPRMIQDLRDNANFHFVDNEAKAGKMLATIQVAEVNFQKNIQNFRDNIEEQKQEVSQAFLGEIETIRNQVRQLDFETISKKDEIIQVTRKEVSKITEQIENFKMFYLKSKDEYMNKINNAKNDLEDVLSKIYVLYKEKYQEMVEESIKLEQDEASKIQNLIKVSREEFIRIDNFLNELKELHTDLKEDYLEQTISAQNKLKEQVSEINHFTDTFKGLYDESFQNYASLVDKKELTLKNHTDLLYDEFKKIHIDLKDDYLEQTISAQNKLKEQAVEMNHFTNTFKGLYDESFQNYTSLVDKKELILKDNTGLLYDEFKKLHTDLKQDYLTEANLIQSNLKEEIGNINYVMSDFKKLSNESTQNYTSLSEESEAALKNDMNNFSDEFKEFYIELKEKIQQLYINMEDKFNKLNINLKEDYLSETKEAKNKLNITCEKLFDNYKKDLFEEIEKGTEEHSDLIQKVEVLSGKIDEIFIKSEKKLLETYHENHDNHLDTLKKEFTTYQFNLSEMAEKWESRLESLSLDAKDTLHKGQIGLEKQRTSMIEGSREILSKLVEVETEKINESTSLVLKKIEIEAKDIISLKIDLQAKQADLMVHLKEQKKKIESELKIITYERLDSFEKEGNQRKNQFNDDLNQVTEKGLEKVMVVLESADSDMHSLKENYVNEIRKIQEKQEHKIDNIEKNVVDLNHEIGSLQSNLTSFKAESKTIEIIQNKTNDLKDMIDQVDMNLEKIGKKENDMSDIFAQVDELKDVRIQLDRKISILSEKSEKIDEVEEKLNSLIYAKDEIEGRSKNLDNVKQQLDEILDNHKKLESEKQKTDITLEELLNQQNLIASAIESVNIQDHNITEITEHISKMDTLLKKLDTKAENLRAHMEGLNTQMLSIEKSEAEIESVQEKFLQIEDLLEDIEKRKTQIEVMRKRYENLKEALNSSVEQIVKIENSAEEKVKRLADFVNAVGGDLASDGSTSNLKKLQTSKKDVVIRLARMGWSGHEIAEKIDVDMSTVETILSTNPH